MRGAASGPAGQQHLAPAFWAQQHGDEPIAVAEPGAALGHPVRGQQDELNIRPVEGRTGADEPARMEQVVGKNAAPEQEVLQHVPRAPGQRAPRNPVRNGGRAEMLDRGREVILQIAPDAGQVMHHVDPMPAQFAPRADAGAHQNHRRSNRSTADDDFTPGEQLLGR